MNKRRIVAVILLAALAYLTWRVVGLQPYRVDVDVYRIGARTWLDGHPLYGGVKFPTQTADGPLPFTYPPLAAILFAPFAWMTLPAATTTLIVVTVLALVVSVALVASALDLWPILTGLAVVVAAICLEAEPLWANFSYGQINAVLMAAVIADCLPRRTWWPRGVLVGLAAAVKLTPAVFVLYFLLRRDRRATLTAVATFVVVTAAAAATAPADSWAYWTSAVHNTDRVGPPSLETNQNIAGALARLHVPPSLSLVLWALLSVAVVALTAWAARRALRVDERVLALTCVALCGLVISPVSWSHHWVWVLPTLVATAVVGYRRRNVGLLIVTALGLVLVTPLPLQWLTGDDAHLWFRWLGVPYVYWVLAVIAAVGGYAAAERPASTASRAVPSLTSEA